MAGYTNTGAQPIQVPRLGKVNPGQEAFLFSGEYLPRAILDDFPELVLSTESGSPWTTKKTVVFPHTFTDLGEFKTLALFNDTETKLSVFPNSTTGDSDVLVIPAGAYFPITNQRDINSLRVESDSDGSVFLTCCP